MSIKLTAGWKEEMSSINIKVVGVRDEWHNLVADAGLSNDGTVITDDLSLIRLLSDLTTMRNKIDALVKKYTDLFTAMEVSINLKPMHNEATVAFHNAQDNMSGGAYDFGEEVKNWARLCFALMKIITPAFKKANAILRWYPKMMRMMRARTFFLLKKKQFPPNVIDKIKDLV